MVVSRRSPSRYAAPFAVVALATLARWALDPYLGDRAPFVTYFIAVAVASWLGGAVPGLVTLVLGGLAADYFFISPRGSLAIAKMEQAIGMVLYFFTGLVLVTLAESQRRARLRAERSAGEALDRQVQLEVEIARREEVEREREGLLAEQARLRAVAEEQSATLSSLFDQAPVGIVLLDADLRHLQANSKAATTIGQTTDRMIGRTLGEVLAGIVSEGEVSSVERIFRHTVETGEPFSAKGWASRWNGPDAEVIYLDWSLHRVERPEGGALGLLGTFVDVTEDIRRGQALRQSEERFRLAAEAVDGLIYDADTTTGRVERTRGLFELLGYKPEEVPPTLEWWMEQVHPDDVGQLLEWVAHHGNSWERFGHEYRVRHRDGHYLHVIDRSLAATNEAGEVVRMVGCTQDVTEIRQAEQALREADRRKNEFLAVLAHEIRNPLASIRNSLRLMKGAEGGGGWDGNGMTEAVDIEPERAIAERQVAHLARLIDDLMDVSRITRGRIELSKRPVELAAVVARAVESIRSPLLRRGHDLSVDLPDEPVRLEADPTRLEQVFGNLLNNAIKYTNPGGRIGLSAVVEGGEVVVRVRDTGLGIEPVMLPKVFEMFVQDAHHSGHSEGGLGIGLGLSKSLVELHGGRISARSEGPGLGSEFEVRLPLSMAADPGPVAPDHFARSNQGFKVPRRRILVVEDNEAVARSLAKLLERMYGQEVRVAHDGPSALELAEEFRPEVVLLDIGLPGMDGCEVARRLRRRPQFAETVVIALTGWGQEADLRRSREAGIDRHLVKPIDPDELGELIAGASGGWAVDQTSTPAPLTRPA